MPSVGPFYFNTAVNINNGGNDWINPDNAEGAPDGNFATYHIDLNTFGSYLRLTNMNASLPYIPQDCYLSGCELSFDAYQDSGSIQNLLVFARMFPNPQGSDLEGLNVGTSLTWSSYIGSQTKLFQPLGTFTSAQVNDTGFGFDVGFETSSGGSGYTIFIDSVRVLLYYTPISQIVSNKIETFPALPWMREGQVPKVRLRKKSRQYFPTGKPLYLQSKTISSNFNKPAISLKLNKSGLTI